MTHEKTKPEDVIEEEQNQETEQEGQQTEKVEESIEDKVANLKDQLLRALAEVENTRRRSAREIDDAKKYAISSFARDILNVADNLRRGLEAVTEEQIEGFPEEAKTLIHGVQLTEKELLSVFDRHGVKKIVPMGEPFNHDFHQAMFEVETTEHPAGIVVEVMQPGYVLDGRLLRPAMVGISKPPQK